LKIVRDLSGSNSHQFEKVGNQISIEERMTNRPETGWPDMNQMICAIRDISLETANKWQSALERRTIA
jgi:hypothetical protein